MDEAGALALLQAGRLEEAEAAWRALAARHPGDARALHFLGCAVAARGRIDEGLALIDESLRLAPRNAMFLNNRARVLADAGRPEDAVAELRRALRVDPAFAAAYLHLGALLRRMGRDEEALAALRRAAALDRDNPAAHATLARLLFEGADFAGALRAYERALELRPGDPDLLNNLGLTLNALGERDAAMERLREALARRPRFADAMLNLGNVHKDRGDLESAARLYDAALAERPDFPDALVNAAGAALDSGDVVRARSLYERALRLEPGLADARYGLAQIDLREQRFAEGWAGYEWRLRTRPPQAAVRDLGLPRLTHDDLGRVRRVAVLAEQGIGDEILFATLLPELRGRGIAAVVEADARLKPIFERSLAGLEFVARGAPPEAFAGCEAQIPIGSLPALLRPDRASFAGQPSSLLAADPRRVREIGARLGPGRWIAVSWRSLQKGGRAALAARKSIPLEAFAALSERTGARLLDLQYGDVDAERREFEARHPGALRRVEGLDLWNDIDGILAAIAHCEQVVTASNATAHFAGALGKPTTVACLAGWAPFHYWVPGPDGRSLWHPSVRIAADPSWKTWDEALGAIAAGL